MTKSRVLATSSDFSCLDAEDVAKTGEYADLRSWSLRECREKSPYLWAIRNYLAKDFEKPCANCKLPVQCNSGSLAQKFIANGDLRKSPDPMCILGRYQTR